MATIYYPGCQPSTGKWPTLRLEQLEAIYRIEREMTDPSRSKSVLVGAGMGSGKTVVTCEVIRHLSPKRVLIVGVRDAYSQWVKCWKEQGGTRQVYRINSTTDGQAALLRLLLGGEGIFYGGLEAIRSLDWETVSETFQTSATTLKAWPDMEPTFTKKESVQKKVFAKMEPVDFLVSDESHRHSNQQSDSIKTINSIPAISKIALSGTFFGNKFENAWSTCTWLWGKYVIGTKGDFQHFYCDVQPVMTKDGRKQLKTPGGFPLTKIAGEKNPGEYVQTLPCYVFIPTPIGDPPEPEVVYVDLGSEQTRQYEEMQSQSLTWVPTAVTQVRAPLVADIPLTQRMRLRTAALGTMKLVPGKGEDDPDSITFEDDCISSTLNEVYEVLHRPGWIGRKALILTHSKPFAKLMARRISKKYPVLLKTGDTASGAWDKQKESFMLPVSETGVQYLVAVISAVGTAMDGLQANCSNVLWASEDENNINNIQGSNRVWRQGVDLDAYLAVKIVQRSTIAEGVILKNNNHRKSTMESVRGTK